MKKIIVMMLCVILTCSLAVSTLAAGQGLTISSATAKAGDTVYLSVTLNEAVRGDSVGISYSYDSKVLKPLPAASSWSSNGVLQNFNNKNAGVWAVSSAQVLEGKICILAFEVKESAEFTDTVVSCSVTVMNNADQVGAYNAESTVSYDCDHSFSEWSDSGAAGHSRKCSKCKATVTESHSWDDGVQMTDPEDADKCILLYTCGVCEGTKQIDVPGNPRPTEPHPTEPEPTQPKPTEPKPTETLPPRPTEPAISPTIPIPTTPSPSTNPTNPPKDSEPERPYDKNQSDIKNPTTPVNPTSPTKPANPEQDRPQETTQPPYKDYNQSEGTSSMPQPEIVIGESDQDHNGHEHDLIDEPPMVVTMDPDNVQILPDEHDHDHDHDHDELIQGYPADVTTEDGGNPIVTIVAVVATVAVLCGLGLWFIKKKKR